MRQIEIHYERANIKQYLFFKIYFLNPLINNRNCQFGEKWQNYFFADSTDLFLAGDEELFCGVQIFLTQDFFSLQHFTSFTGVFFCAALETATGLLLSLFAETAGVVLKLAGGGMMTAPLTFDRSDA